MNKSSDLWVSNSRARYFLSRVSPMMRLRDRMNRTLLDFLLFDRREKWPPFVCEGAGVMPL